MIQKKIPKVNRFSSADLWNNSIIFTFDLEHEHSRSHFKNGQGHIRT